MPESNRFVLFFGTVLTYFSYHFMDEDLTYFSYVCKSVSEVRTSIAPSNSSDFKDAVAVLIDALEFVNELKGGARKLLAIKSTVFGFRS